MGSLGTKCSRASIPEAVQPTRLDIIDGPLFDSGEYKLSDLTYKVQRLTLLVAGGELPISSDQELWQDITNLSDALNRLRSLYPEELRAKSKSLLSLFESQVFSADRKPCLPRKTSVSVQCDDELFASSINSDSDSSDNSIRASSDSLAGDVVVSSSDRKSDIEYICSECNGSIRVFDNDMFALSLKLHYEGAAHSQDSGQRSDKEDCRTTSSSSESSSCSPSEVSETPGEPVDCYNVFSASETEAAVNVCIVKHSHSDNTVRLTRCGVDVTPRHVTMWNCVRNRLLELGHVDYIILNPGLKNFRCSLCKTSITGIQNIMQHVLGNTHTKLHSEAIGDKPSCKDDGIKIGGSSLDVSSVNAKEGKFEHKSKTKVFETNENCSTLKKHSSAHELRDFQPFSDQVMNITPKLYADGAVNYVAWQSMAQELRDKGVDACIQIFNCSLCSVQLTGIQKFIEHVHSYGHKDKNCQPKRQHRLHVAEKVPSVGNEGLKSSSSIEEISTLQYKCMPCNLTLTEKDVLAHLAGKKHALKESYMRGSLKDNVENVGSLCKSSYDGSKLSQKVMNDNTLREQNGNFLYKENFPLALNPYVRNGIEAIPKCDQSAQTISISNNVNSSEKDLGVASKKILDVEKKYYSKQNTVCRTGYNWYSSRHYNGIHGRKDEMLQTSLPCNYDALKRRTGYWCGVCNIMVDESHRYYHIPQDVKLPCVPQQQVFGSAQYLIMSPSQNWGQ